MSKITAEQLAESSRIVREAELISIKRDHLPECRLHGPCPVTESDHVVRKAALRDVCFECEEECICDRLRAAEQRGWENAMLRRNDGYAEGVKAARDAVEAQKVKWSIDYDTAIDDALNAIDGAAQ